jgi:hypothetical protein
VKIERRRRACSSGWHRLLEASALSINHREGSARLTNEPNIERAGGKTKKKKMRPPVRPHHSAGPSPYVLRLLDTGELRLIDGGNATLCGSAPADTLLLRQTVPLVVPR